MCLVRVCPPMFLVVVIAAAVDLIGEIKALKHTFTENIWWTV